MTYPAELSYKKDRCLTPSARRVYDYLSTILDFTEVREVKASVHCVECGIGKPHFLAGLNTLVERGYLTEHVPAGRIRRFTLAWSINRDRQQASRALSASLPV